MNDVLNNCIDRFIRDCGFEVLSVDSVEYAVRLEKSCLISDIFRVTKASVCLDSVHPRNLASAVLYFDRLYELSILELELLLAQMCAELSRYMRDNVRAVCSSPIVWPEWPRNSDGSYSSLSDLDEE